MAITVKIPTPLRRFAGERSEVAVAAADVGSVLDSLFAECPGLKPQLVGDSGAIRNFVNLFVNGEDVRFLDGPRTKVADGDTIAIVPAIAGGAA